MVTSNVKGQIVYIYFDGNIEIQTFANFSNQHFFDYQDINSDGRFEYVFTDKNRFQVFDQNTNQLIDYKFKTTIKDCPVTYSFPYGEKRIGVVSRDENLIYLFNNQGKLFSGFPLPGKSLFSIGKLNPKQEKYNLIVGGDDNFLYNYYLN